VRGAPVTVKMNLFQFHVPPDRILREIVVRSIFFLPAETRRRIERLHRGWEEYRRLRRADAVVVSYGKSGRTWLRMLLSRWFQLRYGLPPHAMLGFDNFHRADPRIPKIFFTHDNYLRDWTGHRDDRRDFYDRRTVLLVRDPRDVAVSQFFQWKYRMRAAKKRLNRYPLEEVDLYDFVTGPAGLPRIVDFLNAWARELPRIRELLVVRYEDMRADTARELRRILEFLGERPTDAELADCVTFASVENMRRLEERRVFRLAGTRLVPGQRGNPDSYKVRRAKVGGWRDYFDDAQIRAIDAYVRERLDPVFGYVAAGVPAAGRAVRPEGEAAVVATDPSGGDVR